jgi:site-specific recombinase XerD
MIRMASGAQSVRHLRTGPSGPTRPGSLKFGSVDVDLVAVADINEAIIGGHLRELHRRGLAPATIAMRQRCALRLAEWMAPATLAEATAGDIELFLDSRELSPRTRYGWCSNLHRVFDWAVRHELLDRDPTVRVIRPKTDRLYPRPISDHDLAEAIQRAPSSTMRAWLLLGSLAGLRVSEIAGLKRSDILEADMLLRIFGKGRKERIVPMHDAVLEALHAYGIPRFGPVFVRPHGPAYTSSMVSRWIGAYLESIEIDATAHQLRHWFGTNTYRECRDLRTVQELLGHSSPSTTAVYTALSPERAREAVDALAMPA